MGILNPAVLTLALLSIVLFMSGLILIIGLCLKGNFKVRIVGGVLGGLIGMSGVAAWFLLVLPPC